ncbi:uncharacterized protein LOC118424500 isoform X2 [Branchiostoma floridae]|nr:uncharacterized protein LOC118424500 isoform X2 [Branchiostoma floridae]
MIVIPEDDPDPAPPNVCFLCGTTNSSESNHLSQICEPHSIHLRCICGPCRILPETVKSLAERLKKLEDLAPANGRNESDFQDDLTREVQRLRDEKASLLKVIQVLTDEKIDGDRSSEWRQVKGGQAPRRQDKRSATEETFITSNRFSLLDCTDGEQETPSEECDASPADEHNQIASYRKQQQRQFYKTKAPKKTVIIGDSMIKGLKPSKMSKNRNVKCFTHRGARVEQLMSPSSRIVSSETPDTVILHAGTNNSSDSVQVIIEKTRNLSSTLQDTGVRRIAVSGVISRADTDPERTHLINLGLARMCKANDWNFNDNSNIGPYYICHDGVHLNSQGTIQLARNLISFIRGENQPRVRLGTSYSDATRTTASVDFRGRGAPSSRWKVRTAEQTRLLRLAETMWD